MKIAVHKTLKADIILIGGLLYTIGVIFYTKKDIKYFHSIWHIFTVTASVFHYFSVMLMIMQ